jgi:hypothetical protein
MPHVGFTPTGAAWMGMEGGWRTSGVFSMIWTQFQRNSLMGRKVLTCRMKRLHHALAIEVQRGSNEPKRGIVVLGSFDRGSTSCFVCYGASFPSKIA